MPNCNQFMLVLFLFRKANLYYRKQKKHNFLFQIEHVQSVNLEDLSASQASCFDFLQDKTFLKSNLFEIPFCSQVKFCMLPAL